MANIKQQFVEFRKTTPKHVQWLLLVAAFIVVIILLTLVLQRYYGGKRKNKTVVETKPVEWFFAPDQLNFEDVKVDDTLQHEIKINVTDSVFIDDMFIDFDKKKENWVITGDCKGGIISSSCTAIVEYSPNATKDKTTTSLVIVYHLPDEADNTQTKKIPVVFSAIEPLKSEPVSESKPELVSESKPEPLQETEQELESEPEQEPIKIVEEVEIVAPAITFAEPEPEYALPSEKCSDFAIPGYNQSGIQIGWIKPSSGANYFYPLSDKDCSKPTGKYDWSTGIITSLKDGSKIGTDADHLGYRNVKNRNLTLPNLSEPIGSSAIASNGQFENAVWSTGGMKKLSEKEGWNADAPNYLGSAEEDESVTSSAPYDRTFILRQFKPIPATIVSEVRADASVYGCTTGSTECDPNKNHSIPVRATVDRNVYSDDGRTIIIPTGTLLMGYLSGELPGPYQTFGRMNIKWYQFIRPDGVEFNFGGPEQDPYSGDAQGRIGVPGRGSTDYVEQMVMPILTAMVPAAVNLIAPIADTFVNQINLDSNTVVQSGTVRSSEMAKQEIINQWNRITNKLVFDAINNTVPPFSIPAGTRINVYSPVDLIVTCGLSGNKKCAFKEYNDKKRRRWKELKNVSINPKDSSWVGQVRSWDLQDYCEEDTKSKTGKLKPKDNWMKSGYDYRTVLMFCESLTYEAKNNAKSNAYNANVESTATQKYGGAQYNAATGTWEKTGDTEQQKAYNQEVLGLQYAEDGETILNPFAKSSNKATPEDAVLTCDDGSAPDANGCCTGETYTDMGEQGFNCCPDSGGDCFPPITVE